MKPDTVSAARSIPQSLRYALRRPRGRILLAAVILAAVTGWYVTTRGGWVNALRLPPTLDASTPRSQNGWTLEDVQLPAYTQDKNQQTVSGFSLGRASYSNVILDGADRADAFGIWLTSPHEDRAADSQKPNLFSASARLSNGESLRLGWLVRHWKSGQALVFVGLPTGYSPACRFAEITLSDRHGHTACWRFSRLPRMQQAIPSPVTAVTSVTQNGITVSAQAWNVPTGVCGYRFTSTVPPNSHQWEMVVTRREYIWEPFGYTGEAGFHPLPTKINPNNKAPGASTVYDGYTDFNYYPRTNRFLQMTAEMHQFETYDEMVTFHNVIVKHDRTFNVYCIVLPKQLSQTTPSGVTITLPAQDGKSGFMTMDNCLNVQVSTSPKITFQQTESLLPNSPLARAYGKPVHLSLMFTPPGKSPGGSDGQGDGPAYYALSLWGTRPLPPVLKDFTITVHQRVDLQTLPMIFTVPIADHAPQLIDKGLFQ